MSRVSKVVILVVVIVMVLLLIYGIHFRGEVGAKGYRYMDQPIVLVDTEVYPVYIDIMFRRGEIIEMERAIERWNKVLNGYRRLEVVSDEYTFEDLGIAKLGVEGKVYIILRLEPDSELLMERRGSVTLAFTNEIGGTIMYMVPMNIEGFKSEGVSVYGVMLHEIGHWFGARHVEVGLMEARYNVGEFPCVDEGTVRQVSKWFRGYEWERMNYCVEED